MTALKTIEPSINAAPKIVRYDELEPCYDAFIDTRSPGSDQKENFTIIGPGVSENPNQYVHIAEPHGFNIGGARQPPGCLNSQHSHDTAEVFFVHTGTWSFNLGEDGTDAQLVLEPGDLISIPTRVFRGFENIGEDMGFLWGILGGDDPGRVMWAPAVFDMAKDYGLVLLENGNLIDTAKGEVVPEGVSPMPVTTDAQVNALDKLSVEQLRACCVLKGEAAPTYNRQGLTLRKLISSDAKLSWEHGFSACHMQLARGGSTDVETYEGAEVVFVHEGELVIGTGEGDWTLGPGDTATLPKGVARQYKNLSDECVNYIRVQGDL